MNEDRVLVTRHAVDFRKLVGRIETHPGLVILEESSRETSWKQLEAALDHIRAVMILAPG